jgi:hypothetical protein
MLTIIADEFFLLKKKILLNCVVSFERDCKNEQN